MTFCINGDLIRTPSNSIKTLQKVGVGTQDVPPPNPAKARPLAKMLCLEWQDPMR